MGQMSPERQKRLRAEGDRNAQGGAFYKFSNKQSDTIRILPYGDGEDLGLKVVSHFIQNKSYVCPFGTAGLPSVIERARAALSKINKPLAQEFAATLDESKRTKFILKVISRLNESQPVIMEAPYKIYQAALDAGKEDGDDVTSVLEGCDIRWSKEGSAKSTKYSARTLKPSPLLKTKEERKTLLALAKDLKREDSIRYNERGALEALKELLPEKLWAQIEDQVLSALASSGKKDDEEGDDEDADEDSSKSKKSKSKDDDDEDATDSDGDDDEADADDEDEKPKGKKKSKSEDDDEDADDAEEGDEDEDEKPAKSKKSSKSDEDDEEGDDEDDEEEAPKSKKSKSKDDDEDEEGDDDEDEEEKPKGKKTGKTSKKDDDEDEDADDEEGDDEDEDEEDAPKSKTGKAKNGKKYEVEEDEDEEADEKPAKKKK